VWVVYPTIRTIIRSFYDRDGSSFVWFDNYKEIFTSDILLTAVKNNLLWVAVVPALVVSVGLVFAVLMERVSWAVAFRTAVFMPMAISAFAAGITWRIVYQQDPNLGVANAMIKSVEGVFTSSGVLTRALPSSPSLVQKNGGIQLKNPISTGDVAQLGLTGIPPADVPTGAVDARTPEPVDGGIAGVVWRDFKPGGGTPGKVEAGELGLPGVSLELLDDSGSKVASATSGDDGSFAFDNVGGGTYTVGIAASTFAKPFGGVDWLGPRLVTPSIMIAYLWIWAGFAMVVIAAGLAAIPRDVLEAARTDGATEFQVFRRVTAPLLAPVLTVVFVTMLINVLKVFDIVISIAPGSSQDDATVLALAMWRTAFGGTNDFGVGSAIAVLIFVLVIPVLLLNVRRFKREA
jgi:alpha-glucoside transport system permease protein